MNQITRIISIISSAVASLFTLGCQKEPARIYDLPQNLDDYRHTNKTHLEKPSKIKPTSQAEADPSTLLETEEGPSRIYNPPERLNGDDFPSYIQQIESDGIPQDIYGPPPMDEEPE